MLAKTSLPVRDGLVVVSWLVVNVRSRCLFDGCEMIMKL